MMKSIKLENAGQHNPRAKPVHAQTIIEPNYHFIDQVSMNAGMGRLSAELSYTQAVANMEMRQGQMALDIANMNLNDAYDEIKANQSEMGEALQLMQEQTRQRMSILDQQRTYFNGIATTNILSSYNEKIFEKRNEDLNENPSGEGHMNRMLKFHDELVAGYLSASLDPAIKQRLVPAFADSGRRLANESFDAEQARLVAKAELDLEDALSRATLHIANGMNPEEAVKELDPVMETIPNSLPWKAKAFKKSRQQLIEFSLLRTAALNPALAEQNLRNRGGIYAEVSAQGVMRAEHAIEAAYKDQERKRTAENQFKIAHGLSAHADFLKTCQTKITMGQFGESELEAAKSGLSKDEYNYLMRMLHKHREAEDIANAKEIALETMANQTGSYAFASAGDQKQIWIKKTMTEQWKDSEGNPADATNIMRAQALEAEKFSTALPIYKKMLKNKIMNGTREEVMDAVAAFDSTYRNNRCVLGSDKDTEVQQMQMVSVCLQDGYSIEEARKKAKQVTEYIEAEDKRELKRDAEDVLDEGIEDNLKSYDEDLAATYKEDAEFRRQFDKIYTRNHVIARGDKKLAIEMTTNETMATYRTTSVNGPMYTDVPMWGPPEAYLADKSLKEGHLRVSFCNSAIAKSLTSGFKLEAPKAGQANICTFPNGDKGQYFIVPVPGTIGKYYVKAARTESHIFADPTLDIAGSEYICDKSGVVPTPIVISIDEVFDIGD